MDGGGLGQDRPPADRSSPDATPIRPAAARIAGPDIAGEVARLKREARGNIFAFSGAGLANSLLAHDVVDEMRLMVAPLLFGDGKRLFADGRPAAVFALMDARPLDTGSVILRYRRTREG
ncbi:dihydrofolate reductase family protein [Neoroseomonas eburnea]|uniref:dihydrofolate reductase family protein n=1 Tax=Neoroseomonas eburnea TaxID=1346889 RepID=UPI001BADABD7